MYQSLKDDGIFCVIVPNGEGIKSLKDSIRNRFHLFHYSKKSLKILGEKNGFKIQYISSYKIMEKNIFRIHKFLHKLRLSKISKLLYLHYPFEETESDGEEIRVCFKKI